jgi:hypothetical protein
MRPTDIVILIALLTLMFFSIQDGFRLKNVEDTIVKMQEAHEP